MARPGVTYMEVAEAAEDILGQGKTPTIEQIRQKLGTGSSTTIANHLRDWKQRLAGLDVATIKDKLPQDLMTIVKGLWDKVIDQSQEQIGVVEAQAESRIAELEQEVNKYKSNNQRWQQLFNQWMSEKKQLSSELFDLKNKHALLEKEHTYIVLKNEGLMRQLSEKNAHIQDLVAVHQQSQKNHDALQVERNRERDKFEREQSESHEHICRLNKLVDDMKEKLINIQNEIYKTQHDKKLLAEINVNMKSELAVLTQRCQSYLKILFHYEERHKEMNLVVASKEQQQLDAYAENKHYQTKMHDLNELLKFTDHKIKILERENWELLRLQEKAEEDA